MKQVILLGLLLLFSSRVAAASNETSFALTSRPSPASFRILDPKGVIVLQGQTPFVGRLASGVYRLVVERVGFHNEARTMKIEADKPSILEIELLPDPSAKNAPSNSPQPPPPPQLPSSPQPPSSLPSSSVLPRSLVSTSQPSSSPALRRPTSAPEDRGGSGLPIVPPSGLPPKVTQDTPPPTSNPATASGPTSKAAGPPSKGAEPSRPIPWIPLGIGAACGIASGIFYAISQSSLQASKDRTRTQADAYNEYQAANGHQSTALYLLIATGAAVVISGLLYFRLAGPRPSGSQGNFILGEKGSASPKQTPLSPLAKTPPFESDGSGRSTLLLDLRP